MTTLEAPRPSLLQRMQARDVLLGKVPINNRFQVSQRPGWMQAVFKPDDMQREADGVAAAVVEILKCAEGKENESFTYQPATALHGHLVEVEMGLLDRVRKNLTGDLQVTPRFNGNHKHHD